MVKNTHSYPAGLIRHAGGFCLVVPEITDSTANSGTATPTSITNPLTDWKIDDTRQIKFIGSDGSQLSIRRGTSMADWNIDASPSITRPIPVKYALVV
jgi:hypothetical protein